MASEEKKRMRLVLSCIPYQGHINPMIQLANILDSKGFSIIFILTKSTPLDQSKYPNIHFRRIPDGLSEDEEAAKLDITGVLVQLNINLVDPFHECLVNLLSESSSSNILCLISDANWYFTQKVADDLNLPMIVFRMTSICSFLVFDHLPILRQKGYLSTQDSEREDEEIIEFPPLKVKDIQLIAANQEEQVLYIENMLKSCKASSGLIFNTFKELEGNQLSKITHSFGGIKTFAIGPLHKYFHASSSSFIKHDQTAISWLDTQTPKSVIYVSFGSVAKMEKTQLAEAVWGLSNSNQPFLLVIRPGLIDDDYDWVMGLPDGFLKAVEGRGYIVNWAPQQEVLAHSAVGGFWTHSGWNSVLESLCEGVPMICSPFFGDQLVNSRYVNDVWKVGLLLEKGFERDEIECAIRKLMVEEEGEDIRGRVVSLREQIDFCVHEQGSSCESLQSFIDYVLSL